MTTIEEVRQRYFDVYAVAKEFTEATLRSKHYGIKNFLMFVGDCVINIEAVMSYMASLTKRGCSRNYMYTQIHSIVKPFLLYAEKQGAIERINWDDDLPRRKKV